MLNAFLKKLGGRVALSDDDRTALDAACTAARHYPARHDLIRDGDPPGPVFVFLEGWGCRYKILPEGNRQILAIMMPGDFCDMHTSVLNEMDHTIATVTPSLVATIPRPRMQELIDRRPAITHAFWLMQLVDLGVARSWIASMGRRGSVERVAHLMCELYFRAAVAGVVADGECSMPLSQILIADALGLTPVHVNRVLRQLKAAGVMHLARGTLIISDISRLVAVAGFDGNYLQRRLQMPEQPEALRAVRSG